MKNIDWNNVKEAEEFERLPAGGYICVITGVEDFPDREYLKVEFDVLEGDYQSYFTRLAAGLNFWAGSFIRSYKPKAQPFFKGFLTAVKESNPGFVFNNDENNLLSKTVGLTIGDEEYIGQDGKTKKRYYVEATRSVDAIRKGEFKVPDFKPIKDPGNPMAGFNPLPDDELPF